jgi:dienelactone hydrolase
VRLTATCLVSLALVSGCGGTEEPATQTGGITESDTISMSVDCVREGDGYETEIVHFKTSDGARIDGVSILHGDVGIAFAHQQDSDVCSWMPYAYRFTFTGGPRLLVFNFPDTARLDDYVDAAADELRRSGSDKIILVGVSMGGTASLVVAAERSDVAAVVSLSGPRRFENLDALPAVKRLRIPVLLVAAREDSEFAADARLLHRASPAQDKRLVIVPGFQHGIDLLQDKNVLDLLGRYLFTAFEKASGSGS